jgi:hypothetical protein
MLRKTSTWNPRVSQKVRNTEVNLEEECFGGAGKCGKT